MIYFLGVDVGTESVRVGLFDSNGKLIDHKIETIKIFNFKTDYYEQSSENIWNSVCKCIDEIIKNCINEYKIDLNSIVSIGFDATCSLVVLDDKFNSISVSSSNNHEINVIMWMDHRAKKQTDFINSTNHSCLKTVGNFVSLEMDPPKILWLKENMPETFNKAAHFFSLPDWLVWRFSNMNIRSICCAVCKCLYVSNETSKGWDSTFWSEIGLDELKSNNFSRIGSQVEKPFSFNRNLKISLEMVQKFGLSSNLKVGVSMIDAHAGGVGGLSISMGFLHNLNLDGEYFTAKCEIENILILVAGTSSCLMASSKTPNYINGIWGPYYEAMVPYYFLNEAGQSASGKLIDHLVRNHPSFKDYTETNSIFDKLNTILDEKASNLGLKANELSLLTKNIHIYPDFHGNRSPLADSQMVGSIVGLNFDIGLENLAVLYLECIQSLAYQTKQIINEMNMNFKVMNIIGGLSKNKLYCQLHSDICQLPVIVTDNSEPVLLGSAILGASNYFENIEFDQLLNKFSCYSAKNTRIIHPNKSLDEFHKKKFKVFLKMLQDQRSYRDLMS